MHGIQLLLSAGVLYAALAGGEERGPNAGTLGCFEVVEVFVDPGTMPLAAYQFELSDAEGRVTIVGVEGGAAPAFAAPPYYDPMALAGGNRIIIAAFSTERDLPSGNTLVARVHLRVAGGARADYKVTLVVAAASDGAAIPATITWKTGETR